MAALLSITTELALESLLLVITSLADVHHLPLAGVHGRLVRLEDARPILYLNSNSSPDQRHHVVLDAYRALAFGNDAAEYARPVPPERHLHSVV